MSRNPTTDFIEEQISDGYRALDFAHVASVPKELPKSEGAALWREPGGDEVSGYPGLAMTAVAEGPGDIHKREWTDYERRLMAQELGVFTIVRWAYNIAIGMLVGAIVVATTASKPLVSFAMGFLALAICSFGNYTAARMGELAWMPAAVASRLTVGALFLSLTALLAAQIY